MKFALYRHVRRMLVSTSAAVLAVGLLAAPSASAHTPSTRLAGSAGFIPPDLGSALSWRNIGPLQGGRSIAVSGSVARPNEYYFGATGGGGGENTGGGKKGETGSHGVLSRLSVCGTAPFPP